MIFMLSAYGLLSYEVRWLSLVVHIKFPRPRAIYSGSNHYSLTYDSCMLHRRSSCVSSLALYMFTLCFTFSRNPSLTTIAICYSFCCHYDYLISGIEYHVPYHCHNKRIVTEVATDWIMAKCNIFYCIKEHHSIHRSCYLCIISRIFDLLISLCASWILSD